jgi:NADH-quinone oxidoreductase subunit A
MTHLTAILAAQEVGAFWPILLLIVMAIGFAIVNIVGSQLLGPRREGPVKGLSYESGMNPVETARKRFNVRFYILAMIFLVFDVEVIFLYPWAATFANIEPQSDLSFMFLARILFFVFTTIVAYLYAVRKGILQFD